MLIYKNFIYAIISYHTYMIVAYMRYATSNSSCGEQGGSIQRGLWGPPASMQTGRQTVGGMPAQAE